MADILQFPDNRHRKIQKIIEKLDQYDENTAISLISAWVQSYTPYHLIAAAEDLGIDSRETSAAKIAATYFLLLKNIHDETMSTADPEELEDLYNRLKILLEISTFNDNQINDISNVKVFGGAPLG